MKETEPELQKDIEMTECPNGHAYDKNEFLICPVCGRK